MENKKILLMAIVFPILVLIGMACFHDYTLRTGEIFKFKITGYDPRDLIAGHYLVYRVNYELPDTEVLCPSSENLDRAYLCLKPEKKFYTDFEQAKVCEAYIQGKCTYGRFEDGLNRFYIPEGKNIILEQAIIAEKGEILVSVGRNGNPKVKELLIEGVPWKDWIQKSVLNP